MRVVIDISKPKQRQFKKRLVKIHSMAPCNTWLLRLQGCGIGTKSLTTEKKLVFSMCHGYFRWVRAVLKKISILMRPHSIRTATLFP